MSVNSKSGLILVDLQHAFEPAPDLVQRIARVLPDYDFVVAMRHINKPSSLFHTELEMKKCYEGCPDAEIVLPLSNAMIFDHNSYGILPGQIEKLRLMNVDRWDVGGVDTHGCVLATCFNLFDSDVKFRVIKELCGSSKGEEMQQAAFKIMEMCFAQFQK